MVDFLLRKLKVVGDAISRPFQESYHAKISLPWNYKVLSDFFVKVSYSHTLIFITYLHYVIFF